MLSLFSTRWTEPWPETDPTRVFILGVQEQRVTMYSQQCRALNLIHALHEARILSEQGGQQIAVVGAGAGGLTAAAAAACRNHRVLLLNDRPEAMSLQRLAAHRWVHPHVFDWPADGWWRKQAGLPLLDWHAECASLVRNEILTQFEGAPWRGRVDVRDGVGDIDVRPDEDDPHQRPKITWTESGKPIEALTVDAVVLAVGFGVEESEYPARPRAYWDSYWDDPGERWTLPGRVVISGSGDGGLTEVLHAVFGDGFDQSEVVELGGWLQGKLGKGKEDEWVRRVRDDVLDFEQRWRHRERPPARRADDVREFYADIYARLGELAPKYREVLEQKRALAKPRAESVRLILGGSDFTPKSSALNRFLVICLLEAGKEQADDTAPHGCPVSVKEGKLDLGFEDTRNDFMNGSERIRLRVGSDDREPEALEAETVVIRHGTKRKPLDCFLGRIQPDVPARTFTGRNAALLDASRRRRWPDGFYSCGHRVYAERSPPHRNDPPLFVRSTRAARMREAASTEPDPDASIVYAALAAAADLGYALTVVALQHISRRPQHDVLKLVSGHLEPSDGTADIEALTAGPAPEVGPTPTTDPDRWLAVGYQRLGSFAGAFVTSGEDEEGQLEDAILGKLDNSLPWWTAYGYARARPRDPLTQLVFAQRLGRESGSADDQARWEERHSALLRGSRAITQDGVDRAMRARTLLALSEFMRELTELLPDDARVANFCRAWRLASERLRAASLFFALEALRPRGFLYSQALNWLLGEIPRRLVPDDAENDLSRRVKRERGDDEAARILQRALHKRVRPNSIVRAEQRLAEDRVREHVEWAAGRH